MRLAPRSLLLVALWLPVLTLSLLARAESATPVKASEPLLFYDTAEFPWEKLAPECILIINENQETDMATVLWLQKTRTPGQVALANRFASVNLDAFRDVLGDSLSAWDEQQVAQMLQAVNKQLKELYEPIKHYYGRPRPFVANMAVEPCVPLEFSASMPSGHALRGLTCALLLADLMPEHREALLERGRQLGYLRVVAGVHYPSDVEVGQRLGEIFASGILQGKAWETWKNTARKAE
jgi:acid phosphatase (class A)